MYRYALSMTKDPDKAQDILQDSLLNIWKRRNTLGQVDNPEAWTMRIVRNRCLDLFRSKKHTELGQAEMKLVYSRSADHDTSYQDQLKWLKEAIEQLPTTQKEIFHLREVEEMAYQEIADILGISINEVKVYLHRARTKIRSIMQKVDAYGIAN